MSTLYTQKYRSPLGELRLYAGDRALIGAYFPSHRRAPRIDAIEVVAHPILERASAELDQYFRGERRVFSVALEGRGTPFQREVWRALSRIPFGARSTYGALAASIEHPRAIRAVGAANALNPLSIFVPCHRVVGADGSMTGYAGGLPSKIWLLEHEAKGVALGMEAVQSRESSFARTASSSPST
jgi:methylated-DNA-[protein]-cysteine S-methyltransferase